MKFGFYKALTLFAVWFIPVFVYPAEIMLNDGTKIEGDIISQNDKEITIQTDVMSVIIPREKIKSGLAQNVNQDEEKKLLEKADDAFKAGKFTDAAKIYNDILKSNPLNHVAHSKLKLINELKLNDTKKTGSLEKTANDTMTTAAKSLSLNTNINNPKNEKANITSSSISSKKEDNLPAPPSSSAVMSENKTAMGGSGNLGNMQNPEPPIDNKTVAPPPPMPVNNNINQAVNVDNSTDAKPPLTDSALKNSQSENLMKPPLDLKASSQNTIDSSAIAGVQNEAKNPFTVKPEAQNNGAPPMQNPQQNIASNIVPQTNTAANFALPKSSITNGASLQSLSNANDIPVKSDIQQTQKQTASAAGSIPPMTAPVMMKPSNSASEITMDRAAYSQIPANYDINSPEFRGVWVTRYDWPDKNPEKAKANIVNIMNAIAASNYNVVLFQIRGQGDVLYRSPKEPWSTLIGGADPGFDPLELAISEAHKRNLQLHAYINLMPVWQGSAPPQHTKPEHPYWLYCSPESQEKWVCVDKNGSPMQPGDEYDKYVFFSPGVPQVNAYLRDIVTDVVKRYNVDGVHFDRIRYPHKDFSHDSISEARFNGDGNPDKLQWEDWERDQVTRILNDIYAACYEIKPNIAVSATPVGIYNRTRLQGYSNFSSAYHDYYQDCFAWVKKGVVDSIMPQLYWDSYPVDKKPDNKKLPCFFDLALDYQKSLPERYVFFGQALYKSGAAWTNDEFEKEINFVRAIGGKGAVAYAYTDLVKKGIGQYLSQKVYPNKVLPPQMPWKTNPATGIIVGYVKDAAGKPVVDAKLNLSERSENWLSSADGYFAMLDVKPGSEKVSAAKTGVGSAEYQNLTIAAGKVSKIDIVLK